MYTYSFLLQYTARKRPCLCVRLPLFIISLDPCSIFYLLLCACTVQVLSKCVAMRVSIWCGQVITSRLVLLMKHVAAKMDSRAWWPVNACVYVGVHGWLRLKSNTGNQSWSPALNHSEPKADGTRQLQAKLQRRCLIAVPKMTFNQLPEDSVSSSQEKAVSEPLQVENCQSGSSRTC